MLANKGGTSDKGPHEKETTSHKGHFSGSFYHSISIIYLTSENTTISIKNKMAGPKSVLYSEVLY